MRQRAAPVLQTIRRGGLSPGDKRRLAVGVVGRSIWFFLARKESALAWPTHHRLPDEVVYEVPSEQRPGHRCREGWVFHCQRLPDRSRSAAAIAEKDAARTPPSRPACRRVGQRGRSDAGGGTGHPGG